MMPLPAVMFLGYALLGGAVFLFFSGTRTFLRPSEVPVSSRAPRRERQAAAMAQAVASLVLATLLLLAATITLLTAAVRLLEA